MTKQKLQNGDSVEVVETETALILNKYDKTGNNITNKTHVSSGDGCIKFPFLCLVEKGGYCVLWIQETSQGFVINLRKYTGLGLASKITSLATENVPDGNLLNVLVQNGSLLTVEWSSHDCMFSGIFNIDGSIHTKENKILHKTETLKEDVGKPTHENIKIEIIEPPVKDPEPEPEPDSKPEPAPEPVEKQRIVRPPVIEIPVTPVIQDIPLNVADTPLNPQVAQTPRRGTPMNFTGTNVNKQQQPLSQITSQQSRLRQLSMNSQAKRRSAGSMGMRFI